MSYNTYSDMGIERVMLEKFKFGVNIEMSKTDLPLYVADMDYYVDYISNRFVYQLRAAVFGKKLEDIKYPLTWWEAVKERFGPKWFLKRYPVKYQTITMEALYPQLPLPYEQERAVIHYTKQPLWWEGK